MPLRPPPGASPEAFRVICLRATRALARGQRVSFAFRSPGSKKCEYCTSRNEKCNPVPSYCEEEFLVLRGHLELWAAARNAGDAEDEGVAFEAVSESAHSLALVAQVVRSQEAGLPAASIQVALFHQGTELLRRVSALEALVSGLRADMAALASGREGGEGSGGVRGRKRKRVEEEEETGEVSDSSLSDP